ncbi:hypothetical protein [Streptomyces yaizuensis]|uniref:Uncharacterized protein n=1 Tax=Streptomyces yaizuensis TaxID=2989713 RepID=A0AA86IZ97_9ACTN|nr:hypothetical protein [Streptomyces sp. YSPA8]BDT39576.1 hypothetical protein SYYSPA8_37290 [Streptomyces sp. YSPA8]
MTGKERGPAANRRRMNALHALENAGLLTFVRSAPAEGGRQFTVIVRGKEHVLASSEVDAFVRGLLAATGRTVDLETPFPED